VNDEGGMIQTVPTNQKAQTGEATHARDPDAELARPLGLEACNGDEDGDPPLGGVCMDVHNNKRCRRGNYLWNWSMNLTHKIVATFKLKP